MAKKKVKAKTIVKVKKSAKAKKSAPKSTVVRAKAKAAPKAVQKKAPARKQPAKVNALAAGYRWVNPTLVVRNVAAAVEFCKAAFGFVLRVAMPGPDGSLMHAELGYKDSVVMLGPENQQMGSFAPQGPSPVTLYVYVENVDSVARRAASAGGKLMMPPTDMFWGDRTAIIVDPDGHNWMLATHYKDMTPADMAKAMESMPPPGPPPTM